MTNQTFVRTLQMSLLMSVLFIIGCEYEFIEPEKVILPEVVSFSDDIQPIFDKGCNFSGCHVSGFGVLDLSPENAYVDLFRRGQIDVETPTQSELYLKISDTGGTHQGRSTPAEQAIILEWIKKGAQNN